MSSIHKSPGYRGIGGWDQKKLRIRLKRFGEEELLPGNEESGGVVCPSGCLRESRSDRHCQIDSAHGPSLWPSNSPDWPVILVEQEAKHDKTRRDCQKKSYLLKIQL
jgi:hypothetical protein